MPVIVPINPAMAEKTSLFHMPKTSRCTISRAVRQVTMAMLKYTA